MSILGGEGLRSFFTHSCSSCNLISSSTSHLASVSILICSRSWYSLIDSHSACRSSSIYSRRLLSSSQRVLYSDSCSSFIQEMFDIFSYSSWSSWNWWVFSWERSIRSFILSSSSLSFSAYTLLDSLKIYCNCSSCRLCWSIDLLLHSSSFLFSSSICFFFSASYVSISFNLSSSCFLFLSIALTCSITHCYFNICFFSNSCISLKCLSSSIHSSSR